MAVFLAVQTAFCFVSAAAPEERSAAISGVFEQLDIDELLNGDTVSIWAPLCHIRLYGTDGTEKYAEKMLAHAEELVSRQGFVAPTDLERTSIVLSMLGKCPRELIDRAVFFNGDFDRQGLNAWIWALIAANCYGAEAPENAPNTRESIAAHLLEKQLPDGGFTLMGTKADADMTAAAVYALAGMDGAEYSFAVNAAVECLSEMQLESGGFMTMGVENCESASQTVIAFCAAGVNDERLTRALDAIMAYRRTDGGFAHLPDGETNRIATVQALEALTAAELSGRGEMLFAADNSAARADDNIAENEDVSSDTGDNVTDSADVPENENVAPETGDNSTDSADIPENKNDVPETGDNPAESADIPENSGAEDHTEAAFGGFQIKLILCVICAAGAAVCIVVFAAKRRKGFLAAALIFAAAGGGVWLLDIKTPDEYYGQSAADGITVTFSADCRTVLGRMDDIDEVVNPASVIPADGVVIPACEVSVPEGGTAFYALTAAARAEKVRVDYTGSSYGVYVSGIGYIYEFGFGSLSGWMYRVNGEFPNVSAGNYVLSEGDAVEFVYTCDLGADVGDEYYGD